MVESNLQAKSGPIKISREDALTMQYDLIHNWTPRSDVWILTWGRGILTAACAISSYSIMAYYRRKLNIVNFGMPVTGVPGVVMPCLMSTVIHQYAVTEPVLLEPQCPVCIQLRSAGIQAVVSVPYPIMVSSLSCFFLANSLGSYRVPVPSFSSLGEYFSIWKTLSKRMFRAMPYHILFQVAIAFIVTEMEAKEIFRIQDKLIQELQSNPS